ncbi:MAG: Flp pilus assembly complex ATPase component TadA [Candidatus Omnitrophica bacterium]|nr:Flp pilus assembly complex ATPase component TadA [Candidatus Omnitrophota bacterium]
MPRLGALKKKLNEILLENKLISEKDLKKALDIQREKGGQLSKILVDQKMISQKDLAVCLGTQLGIPPINLSKYKIDPEVVKLIPERIARHYMVIPISRIKNVISVAMADPLNIFALDDIKVLTKLEVQTVVTTADEIIQAIDKYYAGKTQEMAEIVEKAQETIEMQTVDEGQGITDVAELTKASGEAPLIKLVNVVINEALKSRASDIHLEPFQDRVRVRYRIDGILQEFFTFPVKIKNALITRLKIMSTLDITQKRIPQDGRFKVKVDKKEIDFRVSVLPTAFGGKIVLRALDKANLSIGLDRLGFLPDSLEKFKDAISKPYGMVLLTGPTGCGKSTTLYSILNQLNTTDKNIVTIEDPVEYQVERITQIAVKPEIGLTFASGLRSILRQTPDIIMVGEIRDGETADIAIKASLTGELVLSTLHTNDAASAITRLMDMGVEPFLIASSVIMVAAQRLCRKICPNCKEPQDIPKAVLDEMGIKVPKGAKFYHGKGCSRCNHTGYYGRMGTLEILTLDDNIREMIIKGASSTEIKNYAIAHGMRTLRENGIEKFIRGETTLEEVLRMTAEV